jgi:hypothetical protein
MRESSSTSKIRIAFSHKEAQKVQDSFPKNLCASYAFSWQVFFSGEAIANKDRGQY